MATSFSRSATASAGNKKSTVTLATQPDDNQVSFTVLLDDDGKTSTVTVTWTVDVDDRRLQLDAKPLLLAMNAPCLAGCLMGVGASLAACLLKAKKPADVWKCIEDNWQPSLIGVAGCVIGCM